jgi:methionyl-tRNA formyltransferase
VRTVFLGTAEFAVQVLDRLAASEHRPVLVLTRPDRPRGRGRRVAPPPVARAAAELGIRVEQPPSVNEEDARELVESVRPDAVCVCAFGGLIKEPLLSAHRMLNVHPSLLPRWRGAAPIERAIMAGDEVTGVSIMEVTAGLDSGPVCAQVSEPIAAEDNYGTLARRLARLGGDLLVQTLPDSQPCTEQEATQATYAEKIQAEDRRLEPGRPAAELERVVRALTPHVGAYIELEDGSRLGVLGARAAPGGGTDVGSIQSTPDGLPVLSCSSGQLELIVVKPPGRREMPSADWLRGWRRG